MGREIEGIVIDAGHGGSDPGASGNGIIEKNLNLAISEYMYDRFRELGIPVKMTRTADETLNPDERVERVLNAFGNKDDVIVISNHINAGGGEGAEVIYALRNDNQLADLVLNEIGNEGQLKRETYQRRLPSNPSKDYYFMHRNTGITQPIIVEYGFLDTTSDANRLKNNYIDYAEAVVRAVSQYIGLSDSPNTYVVKKGDSLWSIAKNLNVSVEELKAANNLTGNLINVGQVLNIPKTNEPETGEYTVYRVKSGDTLYSIARNNDVSVNQLIEYNNLATTKLTIGQQLLIPIMSNNENYQTYTVKSGDNLYNIAMKYNTTVDAIKNLNNLTSNILTINQKLLIPETTQSNNEYVVKSGDSLYSIANKYNTTVSELKSINNLTSNLLSIGQVLKIPNNQTNTYTVKSGDTLYSIANKYNTSVNEIKTKNNLTSNTLTIGQQLII